MPLQGVSQEKEQEMQEDVDVVEVDRFRLFDINMIGCMFARLP